MGVRRRFSEISWPAVLDWEPSLFYANGIPDSYAALGKFKDFLLRGAFDKGRVEEE